MRRLFVGGNWKSNGNLSFCKSHCEFLKNMKYNTDQTDVVVFPMNLHLGTVQAALSGSSVQVGAQNLSLQKEGAFTGEVSAVALKDFGLQYTLVGHSERRALYSETNDVVGDKVVMAQSQNLTTVACIGETKEQRESNQTMKVIEEQLSAIQSRNPNWGLMVLAYEPVWAIGTGLTASPEQAQEVHQQIRTWLKSQVSDKVANETRIIYGGSVNEKNCADLIKQPDIDGFLVGGASLKEAFGVICAETKRV